MSEINFEKALSQLESIVTKMEGGQLSLEQSLKHFEKGIQLTQECQQALKAAEQHVEILTEEGAEKLELPDDE